MRAADCKIWRKAPKGDFRHAETDSFGCPFFVSPGKGILYGIYVFSGIPKPFGSRREEKAESYLSCIYYISFFGFGPKPVRSVRCRLSAMQPHRPLWHGRCQVWLRCLPAARFGHYPAAGIGGMRSSKNRLLWSRSGSLSPVHCGRQKE